MSAITEIAEQIRDTSAEAARLEREFAQNPNDDALEINLLGVQKRFGNLQKLFLEETNKNLIDVCEYRIIANNEGIYPVSAISAALSSFQDIVSVFLTAIREGPRLRSRVPADIAQMAELDFAYTYPGSLGFALVIPNERLMFIQSDLDKAIESAFRVVHAKSPSEISAIAKTIGAPPIRKIYQWADAHARHGLTAGIKWHRGSDIIIETLAQHQELQQLRDIIKQTSDETVEHVDLSGTLTGLFSTERIFRFELADGEPIKGRLARGFSISSSIPIPSYQSAQFTKRTTVHYAEDREDVAWELTSVS